MGKNRSGPSDGGFLGKGDEKGQQSDDQAHSGTVGDERGQPVQQIAAPGDQSGDGEERRDGARQGGDRIGSAVSVEGDERAGGRCRWIGAVATLITRPKIPKTVMKPNVMAAVNRSARAAPPGPETSRARNEGNIAKPHGLNAATNPAANASARSSIYRACLSMREDSSASSNGPTAGWLPPSGFTIR